MSIRVIFFILILLFPIFSFSKSWNNTVSLINNTNQPVTFTFKDTDTAVTLVNCINDGKQISNTTYQVNSFSVCKVNIANKKKSEFSLSVVNNGKIIVEMSNDLQNYCTINYSYKENQNNPIADKFTIYAEKFSQANCSGKSADALANMISVKTTKTEDKIRPLGGDKLSMLIQKQNAIYSIVNADCYGSMNCIIVSPNLDAKYNGTYSSSLREALLLQASIDQFESLNIAQFIGVHNALISRNYTTSKNPLNLNIADPDNYLSATEMLNSGVRMLELDVGYLNSQLKICHNHSIENLNNIVCDDNYSLVNALKEINSWIDSNPTEFIILYLDANSGVNSHIQDLDSVLSNSDKYIFTPNLAQQYGMGQGSSLDLSMLTKNQAITKLHKNIIIIVTQGLTDFANSKYIFTEITNSSQHPLYTMSINKFLPKIQYDYSDKYIQMSKIFNADLLHSNWIRLNSARTAIDYYVNANDLSPYIYNDYITIQNIPQLLKYPVNVFALSMFGYACDSSECTQINSDPRLYNLLWSWGLGYPFKNGSDYAYINIKTGHFENEANKNIDYILCDTGINLRTLEKSWVILNAKNANSNDFNDICVQNGGKFTTPTTSYWMDDVIQLANTNQINGNIAINYHKNGDSWVAN